MKPPKYPDRCIHLDYRHATWGYSGGAPEERTCKHPDNRGNDCDEELCPYGDEEPMTHGEAYEAAMEDKFEEEYERSGSRF